MIRCVDHAKHDGATIGLFIDRPGLRRGILKLVSETLAQQVNAFHAPHFLELHEVGPSPPWFQFLIPDGGKRAVQPLDREKIK